MNSRHWHKLHLGIGAENILAIKISGTRLIIHEKMGNFTLIDDYPVDAIPYCLESSADLHL
jgi:hypothetical protein